MFGEGDYDVSEQVIQQLLAEAGADVGDQPLVSVSPEGAEVAADWDDLRTGETYLGDARGSDFASPRARDRASGAGTRSRATCG